MTLQGFNSRRLQGLYRNLQAFGIGTPPTRTLAGIGISSTDKIFVCDKLNHKILVYQLDGTKIDEWGIEGTANGEFIQPQWVSWYNSEVYVYDSGSKKYQVFSESGTWDRTILTNNGGIHVNNGYFYAIEATNSSATAYSFKKYDTDGTLISSFSKSNITVWFWNYETSNLRCLCTIPQDGTFDSPGEDVYERIYTFDDDGTIITTLKFEDYDFDECLLFGIFSADSSYIYGAEPPYIRKHTTGGTFFDSENTGTGSATRTWAGIKKHTDGFIYLTANYADTTVNSKVQVYRADTLAFDSEWTAT